MSAHPSPSPGPLPSLTDRLRARIQGQGAMTFAEFMEAAWGMVLGRLKKGVVAACDPAATVTARPRRTKTRRGA